MMDALHSSFFWIAVLAALVLAGIHAYLGFHIVRRGVLFVDLALAQMAALGVAVAMVAGGEHDPRLQWLLALGATFLGAALFAWLRGASRRVPLEAFIGIVFATAQAAAFLVLAKSPEGTEHIKETLVGSLFTVDPKRVGVIAALYAGIGLVHFVLRKPFFDLTNDGHETSAGRHVFWWDFLFYATFGLVVASAVQVAGVLLVFGYLVIPAVAGLMASGRTGVALAIGWVFAVTSSALGLLGAAALDLPEAPSILVTLSALLLVHAAALVAWRRMRRRA